MGERMYNSTYSYSRHCIESSTWHQAQAPLSPRKEPSTHCIWSSGELLSRSGRCDEDRKNCLAESRFPFVQTVAKSFGLYWDISAAVPTFETLKCCASAAVLDSDIPNFPVFMEPSSSSSCSQEIHAVLHPEPDESGPHPYILFLLTAFLILSSDLCVRSPGGPIPSGILTKM